MKILVSGLINIETNICINNFPVTYSPIEYAFNQINTDFSGVAFNIINALHCLNDKVIPVSILGKDNIAEMIKAELKDKNITTEFVVSQIEKTCSSAILFDTNGTRKIYCDLKDIQDCIFPLSKVEKMAASCDGLILCNINFNDELIKNAQKFGKPIFTDLQDLSDIHDSYNRRFLQNADIVFLSDEKIQGNHEDFLLALRREYQNKIIVLGQGKKGAIILDSDSKKVFSIESVYTRPVVNTVGAGDALFSAFVHYYLKGNTPIECLKKAVTFASWKIGESGGAKGFLSESELEKLSDSIQFKIHEICSFDLF